MPNYEAFIEMEARNPPRTLPTGLIAGFARVAGVPNTPNTKSYFASAVDAIQRCREDQRCIGVSAQRMFYRSDVGSAGRVDIVPGRPGEDAAYMKH